MLGRQKEPLDLDKEKATCSSPWSSPLSTIRVLMGEMEARDPQLCNHGIRTSRYARMLGQAWGCSPDELRDLVRAGLLHDIGKLTLPDDILYKDGPLTAEEYALMQCHPRAGAELLAQFTFLQRAALWIAHHHEHWDGSGYLYGLRGEFIPLGARVLAVADTFDKLIIARYQGNVRSIASELSQLSVMAGTQLDPELVEAFSQETGAVTGNLRRKCSMKSWSKFSERDAPLAPSGGMPPAFLQASRLLFRRTYESGTE